MQYARDKLYRIALVAVAIAIGMFATVTFPAQASDPTPRKSSIAAPQQPLQSAPIPETVVAPWTGVYGSIGGGYGLTGLETAVFGCPKPHGHSRPVCTDGTEDSRLAQGWRGDGRLGFDWQTGSFVFGVLGGWQLGESEYTDSTPSYGPVSITLTPKGYLGGRAGIVSGKTLWYGLVAWQHAEIEANGPGPFSRDIDGVKAGLGIEHQIAPQLALALEGNVTFYESVTNQVDENPGVTYKPRDFEAMLRLNWRPFGK